MTANQSVSDALLGALARAPLGWRALAAARRVRGPARRSRGRVAVGTTSVPALSRETAGQIMAPLAAQAARHGLSLRQYLAALLLQLDDEPPPHPPPGGSAARATPIAPVVSLEAVRRARDTGCPRGRPAVRSAGPMRQEAFDAEVRTSAPTRPRPR